MAERAIRPRRPWLARAGAAVFAIALAAVSADPAKPEVAGAPKTHVVTIENMRFEPQQLTVQRGDRIQWVNKDLFPHTATARAKAFDSGNIDANASWTYEAGKPGDYAYACTFHPTMQARLVVK